MIGGVITSTLLTLLVIPTVYEILDAWRSGVRARVRRAMRREVPHAGAGGETPGEARAGPAE